MPIIDAHVHVWTDDFARYPLAPGWRPEQMEPATFLPEELLSHARPSGVDRILLIQMSFYATDNRYMLDVIRSAPETFQGIAIVDPSSPDPDRQMRALKPQGVRGFRIQPWNSPRDTWLDGAGFERMWRCGAEERLALCPLIDPDALPALSRMCARFPDTPVVIDHMARIGASAPIQEEQIDLLCRMAEHPEVRVKVSAFYALGEKKPPHLDLVPRIRRLYDAFGPERLMWASDCPFQVVEETYEESLSLVRDRLDFLSSEDREWILRGTAERLFFSK
jgi:predicted TIM-barrel fold metal-dependent hydrolase